MTNKEIIKKANEINSELYIFLFSMDYEIRRGLIEAIDNDFRIVVKNEKKIANYKTKYWDIFNQLLKINSKAFIYSNNEGFPIAICLYELRGVYEEITMKDFIRKLINPN